MMRNVQFAAKKVDNKSQLAVKTVSLFNRCYFIQLSLTCTIRHKKKFRPKPNLRLRGVIDSGLEQLLYARLGDIKRPLNC
jgi:hypothetical protein